MDGYSVQEAASVLGVAEGRVWELLARGVLLGTPEGDSMRVFLKGQAGPIATTAAREEPPRGNGNGGTHGSSAEASAFRELLTEFRNLTERYGQALLALGEARGEVAGLRSRVDLLEARLDVRLPPSFDEPLAWEPRDAATVAPQPTPAAAPPAPAARPRRAKPIRRAPKSRKTRTSRDAVAGFAAALERAQDPNPAHLAEASEIAEIEGEPVAPPVVEAVDATEAVLEEVEVLDALVAPPGAVEEELAAESSAEEVAAQAATDEVAPEADAPTYSSVVVEPDWFADGDFAWLDAPEIEPRGGPDADAIIAAAPEATTDVAAEAPPALEPEPVPEALSDAEPEPEPPNLQEAGAPPEVAPAAEPEPDPAAQLQAAFEPEVDFEPWQPPEPVAPEVTAEPSTEGEVALAPEPPTMSTAVAVEELDEEEVMWLGGEPESTAIVRDEPTPTPRAQVDPWPVVDSARPPLAMTEDELARLALDEGWDDSEVAAIRAMISPPPQPAVDLPGAAELHDAMAALEAVPVRPDTSYDTSREWAKPASGADEPPTYDDWGFETEPTPRPAPPANSAPARDVTSALRRSVSDPGWLGRRAGPAAAAYRRLRRFLPG